MTNVKKIPTDLMGIQDSIEENIQLGRMEESKDKPGTYRLTQMGIDFVENMLAKKKTRIMQDKLTGKFWIELWAGDKIVGTLYEGEPGYEEAIKEWKKTKEWPNE